MEVFDYIVLWIKENMMQHFTLLRTGAYINGEFLTKTDRTFAVTNPANGELIANVSCCGRAETEAAIQAAIAARRRRKRKGGIVSIFSRGSFLCLP